MKSAMLILILLMLVPGAYAQHTYNEKVFVYRTSDMIEDSEAEEACADGLTKIAAKWGVTGISPTYTVRAKIHSVKMKAAVGKIKGAEEEIGDVLICQDWQTFWPAVTLVPVYYEIKIGGRRYRAAGAGVSTVFPELDVLPGGGEFLSQPFFPAVRVNLMNFSAIVGPGDPGRFGGMLTVSGIYDWDDIQGDDFETGEVHILRVYVPDSDGP